jgi:peptidoglycan/LPS O-acetylase OafA/YrhL
MTDKRAPATEFISVQYLRGVAALCVVYFHTKIYLSDFFWPVSRQFGFGGVDLFFAISGFIMIVTTAGRQITPQSFYLRRIVRVAPLYWGATLFAALLFMIAPSAVIKQTMTFSHVVLSLFFIPHSVPGEAGTAPFLKIGWTLNLEMFFYLVFGLTLFVRSTERRLAALFVVFTSLVLFGAIAKPTGPVLSCYTSPFLLEFLLGAGVGYVAVAGMLNRISTATACAAITVSIFFVLFLGGSQGDGFARTIIFGFPAAIILASTVSLEQNGVVFRSGLLERFGDASYSIYLGHPFVLTGFKVAARHLNLPVNDALVGSALVCVAVVAAAVVGCALGSLIETPLLKAMQNQLKRLSWKQQLYAPIRQAS